MSLLVNLFAGPGCGKSTTAAGVFSLLKMHDINCELVTEFAKDLTWEERYKTLENQYYVWGKQHHRLWRIKDQVDVMITDSPLILNLVYGKDKPTCFKNTVLASFNEFNNINYFLKRLKIYNPKGRNQTEDESRVIDYDVLKTLLEYDIKYDTAPGNYSGINQITEEILEKLQELVKYKIKEIKNERN